MNELKLDYEQVYRLQVDHKRLEQELAQLKSKCERYEKALKFYAEDENDNPDTTYNNESARQALSNEAKQAMEMEG